jgi:hypothetical protein
MARVGQMIPREKAGHIVRLVRGIVPGDEVTRGRLLVLFLL